MGVALKYEMKLASVLLVALVATYGVMKVEAATMCTNLADCDEGAIEVRWLELNCEGNALYVVRSRANETNACVRDRNGSPIWNRVTCSATDGLVTRTYSDSACKLELASNKYKIESCMNVGWSSMTSAAYFCSKSDAATKTPAAAVSAPTTGYPPYNGSSTYCAANDKQCIDNPKHLGYSYWDTNNCQPLSSPQTIAYLHLDLGVCYADWNNITFYRITCGENAYYEKWYSNGCEQTSLFRERSIVTGTCFPDDNNESVIYRCPSKYSPPSPSSDSARNFASLFSAFLALVAMVFLGM